MSELLDRIETEIRERLAATREAMLEHARLQAALDALTGAGEEAPRAVTSGARGATRRAPQSPTSSSRREREQAKDVRAPAKPRGERSRTAARPAGQGARSAGSPVRQRAPRGANRRAVLRVVGERPGVTAAELSVASGVHRGTLSALLRTLVGRGELEKRSLPGGRTGYAPAASAPAHRSPPLHQVPSRAQRAQQALDRQRTSSLLVRAHR